MSKNGVRSFSQSKFYCTKCGNQGVSLMRSRAKKKEPGHLKKLYCLHCKEEINHIEITENSKYTYEDFLEEFNKNNFIEGQRQTNIWEEGE